MSDRIFTVNFDKVDELKELGYGISMVHTGDIRCFIYKKADEDIDFTAPANYDKAMHSLLITKEHLSQEPDTNWQKTYDTFIDRAITNIKNND
mgnify:FL=1